MPPSQHLPLEQELLFQEKHVTSLDLCSCAVTDVLPGGGGREGQAVRTKLHSSP